MKVLQTAIPDVIIIEPDVFGDNRGYFFESYSQKKFDESVQPIKFLQESIKRVPVFSINVGIGSFILLVLLFFLL